MNVSAVSASDIDIQIQVFSGDCSALTCVKGDNPSTSSATVSFSPSLPFYYVLVGTAYPDESTFDLNISQLSLPNVGCEEALGPVFADRTLRGISGSTSGMPFLPADDACASHGRAQWYYFASSTSGNLKLSTCSGGTTFDTVLSLYNGEVCTDLTCNVKNDDATCSINSRFSTITSSIVANQAYYVSVSSKDVNVDGNFILSYQMI